MIKKIKYIISRQFVPYENLALEEYLLNTVEKGTCILYLWQNQRTVVIGKNQNPWKECKIKELEKGGGYLVRRLSGGGAVFHDLGNLNFTFLMRKEDYDLDRQLEVILRAVKNLGIKAEKSGRNDILAEGKKFSGNAFLTNGDRCYHHGTILVHVDMKNLSAYLNVSKDKLVSKGVDSVKSRVGNLNTYRTDLTIDKMKEELINAFSGVYGLEPEKMELTRKEMDSLKPLTEKFSSFEWNFGKKMEFQDSISGRFTWGGIEIEFQVKEGIVKDCTIFSDAMEVEIIERLKNQLRGCLFKAEHLKEAVDGLSYTGQTEESMKRDIKILLGI